MFMSLSPIKSCLYRVVMLLLAVAAVVLLTVLAGKWQIAQRKVITCIVLVLTGTTSKS